MKACTAALLATFLLCNPTTAATPAQGETAMTDHAHDFDFLIGKWRVHHWRLKDRLANSHEWVEFEGSSTLWMTMDGHGTVDDNVIGLPGGPYRAMGIRGYDPNAQTWSIWWLDARTPQGPLDPPVRGHFENGVGRFEGDDTFNGKPIRVRYTWSRITANSAHWEQAFSSDGGKSWETNWRMDFTRVQ